MFVRKRDTWVGESGRADREEKGEMMRQWDARMVDIWRGAGEVRRRGEKNATGLIEGGRTARQGEEGRAYEGMGHEWGKLRTLLRADKPDKRASRQTA